MTALVVFESMFGNNERIARAVAEGLAARLETEVSEVGAAPTVIPSSVTLLVVGGPNHGFGLSRPESRRDAQKYAKGALVSTGIGLREWLPKVTAGGALEVAVWETRLRRPRIIHWFDRTAKSVQRELTSKGFRAVAGAEHFHVVSTTGPLVEGDLERARAWGERLAEMASSAPR
jgi:hypothetical protein